MINNYFCSLAKSHYHEIHFKLIFFQLSLFFLVCKECSECIHLEGRTRNTEVSQYDLTLMVHFFISSMTINILQILGKALMIFLSVHGTSIMTLIIFLLGKLRLCLYMNLVATTKRRLGNKAMLKNDFFFSFLFKLNY